MMLYFLNMTNVTFKTFENYPDAVHFSSKEISVSHEIISKLSRILIKNMRDSRPVTSQCEMTDPLSQQQLLVQWH